MDEAQQSGRIRPGMFDVVARQERGGRLVTEAAVPTRIDWDAEQYVACIPCCAVEVRLDLLHAEPGLHTAILCDRPACQRIWTVELIDSSDTEAVAIWRLLQRHGNE